jgi:hypothetical protein
MANAQVSCARQLRELIADRDPLTGDLDFRTSVHLVFWGTFLESLESAFKEHFQILCEIGSSNPEYVHPDPAQWAKDLLWKHINYAFNHTVDPGLACSILDIDSAEIPDTDSTEAIRDGMLENTIFPIVAQVEDHVEGDVPEVVTVRTEFWVAILDQFGLVVQDAGIEFARHGWKSSATQSQTISSTPPKLDSNSQSDLSSKLRQTPLPPVGYVWYRDPASGVWNISVPPKPEGFPVKDLVGLAYIQVALREHGKEAPAFQIQAFAEARKVGATLSSAGPGLLDGNRDDEGIAHEGRLNDGLSGYETTQLVLDKTEMSKIKNELKDIETSLAKAELNHDQAQIVLFKTEKEKILEFLDHARGKGKRSRRMKSPHGLACDAVRNGIVRAIDKISKIDSDAGQFLKKYIKTGWIVSYTGPEVNWQFYK